MMCFSLVTSRKPCFWFKQTSPFSRWAKFKDGEKIMGRWKWKRKTTQETQEQMGEAQWARQEMEENKAGSDSDERKSITRERSFKRWYKGYKKSMRRIYDSKKNPSKQLYLLSKFQNVRDNRPGCWFLHKIFIKDIYSFAYGEEHLVIAKCGNYT